MQNLLDALRKLKIKIQHHKNVFYSNIDARYFADTLKQTKKICDIVRLAKSLCDNVIGTRLLNASPQYKTIESLLVAEIAMLRKKLFASVDSHRAFAQKTVSLASTIDSTLKQVNESEKFRQRLINLAQGPLSSLFEYKDQKSPKEEEDTLEIVNIKVQEDTQIKAELRTAEENLFELRLLTDKIYREVSKETQKITLDAIETIKKIKIDLPVCEYYSLPIEIQEADTKLQREIALVLGTLTMDRSAIDSMLRAIKLECEELKKSCDDEHALNTYKTIKEIQALYTQASLDFVKTDHI